MTKNKEIAYSEAIAEIEEILARFESEEFDVDSLSEQVKRATELIALCREKLRRAENDVSEIFSKE